MTTVDTSPEAIAAQPVAWRCRDEYGVVCFTQDPDIASTYPKSMALYAETALAAEIARLTAERDEARAQVARWQADANLMLGFAQLAYESGAKPSSSELIAARDRCFAARDAAMRNEGRRQVKVKPLEWEAGERDQRRADSVVGEFCVTFFGGRWFYKGEPRGGMLAAQAAAQADYEARILAALEPEGGE